MIHHLATQTLENSHGAQACAVRELIRNRDYKALLSFKVCYDSDTIEEIISIRQALAFYQKNDSLPIDIDRAAVAKQIFLDAEEQCRLTNFRLQAPGPSHIDALFYRAQRLVLRALGRTGVPPEFSEIEYSFGPGSNTTVNASVACPRVKLDAGIACSSNLLPVAPDILKNVELWVATHAIKAVSPESDEEIISTYDLEIAITPGKVSFVPKNAKTDRSICVEPLLNSVVQRGYGRHIRDCLERVGVYLKDQSLNQKMARAGSISNRYATLDLSSASDTLAKELVFQLLPPLWADRLYELTTREVLLEGEIIRLEKFSSMGNGFTFELESLIFWALARSVYDHLGRDPWSLTVYGDDIVVDTECYSLLCELLEHCGFSVNREKSFLQVRLGSHAVKTTTLELMFAHSTLGQGGAGIPSLAIIISFIGIMTSPERKG